MASGAAYCQLTHLLFNAINLKKVKFNPRSEPDVLNNWKVLTTTWKDLGIDKPVDVEKMKKAKFQDNMEFLQWFYKVRSFCERHNNFLITFFLQFYNANLTTEPEEYDAVGARFGEDLPALKGSTGSRPVAAPARPVAAAPPKPRPAAPAVAAPAVKASVPPTVRNGTRPAPATSAGTRRADPSASEELLKQGLRFRDNCTIIKFLFLEIEKHKAASDEWETTAKEMETEREYYYSILQRVESLANEAEESGSSTVDVAALKTILYAGNEDTEQVDEIENEHLVESLQANLDDTETF